MRAKLTEAQIARARELQTKGWGLRLIAKELGRSHEAIRRALAKAPAPPPPPPAPAVLRAPIDPHNSLLDICRAMLAELRRRSKAATHPALAARYASDATALSGHLLALEKAEAARADTLTITAAKAHEVMADLRRRARAEIERAQREGRLKCSTCGVTLEVDWGGDEPALEATPDAEPAPRGAVFDDMIAEGREALGWLLGLADGAEAAGNEVQAQRSGRAAVTIAGFLRRLEKELSAARDVGAPIDRGAAEQRWQDSMARVDAARARPLQCPRCAREYALDVVGGAR